MKYIIQDSNSKPDWINIITDKDCEPEKYLISLSNALKLGIDVSASYYSYIVSNMYEILDKDDSFLPEFSEKSVRFNGKRIKELSSQDFNGCIYVNSLFAEFLEGTGKFKEWDVVSLSCVLSSFISFKSDLLENDVYYEIRDMFVPFGMSISQTKINVDELMAGFAEFFKDYSDKKFLLPVKLGKSTVAESLSDELIKAAFEEIYFDEYAND